MLCRTRQRRRSAGALVAIGAPQQTAPSTAQHLLNHSAGGVWHDPTWSSPLSGSSGSPSSTGRGVLAHGVIAASEECWTGPYWRTDLTLRQLGPLFRISKSAAGRIIDHPVPRPALHRRERGQTELPGWKEEHNRSHRRVRARVDRVRLSGPGPARAGPPDNPPRPRRVHRRLGRRPSLRAISYSMHLCFLREVPSFRSKLTDKSPLLRLPPSGTQAQSRRTDRLSRRARYLALTHRRTAESPEIRGFRVVKRRWSWKAASDGSRCTAARPATTRPSMPAPKPRSTSPRSTTLPSA